MAALGPGEAAPRPEACSAGVRPRHGHEPAWHASGPCPAASPERFIDDLLARVDIVDVVSERVPLKKSGREWSARAALPRRALALVHGVADQTVLPLLRLRRARQRHRLPDELRPPGFTDAVELAARVGLKVPRAASAAFRCRTAPTSTPLEAAAKFYQRELARSDRARLSPGADSTPTRRPASASATRPKPARRPQARAGHLAAAHWRCWRTGLIKSGERGGTSQYFRDRVMFPIADRREAAPSPSAGGSWRRPRIPGLKVPQLARDPAVPQGSRSCSACGRCARPMRASA